MTDSPPLATRNPAAWLVFGLSLALGVVGQQLFSAPLGVNVLCWVLLLTLSAVLIARRGGFRLSAWFAVAVLVSACLGWRDSPALNAANLYGLTAALMLGVTSSRGASILSGFLPLLWAGGVSLASLIGGWLGLLAVDLPWRSLMRKRNPNKLIPLARGLALTLPLLLVFGALLSSADAAFGRFMAELFVWRLEGDLIGQIAVIAFWFGVAAGLLRLLTNGVQPWQNGAGFRLGLLEVSMALVGLNLLFLAFIVVQFGYFFGGQGNVTALTGLTYADYARRGSTELIEVVALSFPVLIAALHWHEPSPRVSLIVRGLSGATVTMLGVMLISAWQRLELYRSAYGLTEIRYYTAAFIIWLAGVLIWFCATALRERYALFPRGVVVAAFSALLLLNLFDPGGSIVRSNLARAVAGADLDLAYPLTLGADGLIALSQGEAQLSKTQREDMKNALGGVNTARFQMPDWRSFNLGKTRALELLSGRQP